MSATALRCALRVRIVQVFCRCSRYWTDLDLARKRGQVRRDRHRAAWTALVEGQGAKTNKYHVAPKEERGHYASKHEADETPLQQATEFTAAIAELVKAIKDNIKPDVIDVESE